MKILTKKEILPIALIFFSFATGFFLYSDLPEKVPSHWNIQGEIDSWTSKNFAVFFFPSLILLLYFLMTFIPLIDPFKKNYCKFANHYFLFRFFFVFFFISIYFYTLLASLGLKFNITYFILPFFALSFIFIGLFLPKIKRNYFVGIKTPYTIHSEEVWDKTHKFSGKVFIFAGLIALISILIPNYSFHIFTISILVTVLIPIIYSYFVFRKLK